MWGIIPPRMTKMPILPKIQQCSYVRPNGNRCGSPAYTYARNGDHDRCFHHDRDRYPDPIDPTPQLREIADVLSDPNFFDYIQGLADRLHSGKPSPTNSK
jgi:hypothetical protein